MSCEWRLAAPSPVAPCALTKCVDGDVDVDVAVVVVVVVGNRNVYCQQAKVGRASSACRVGQTTLRWLRVPRRQAPARP